MVWSISLHFETIIGKKHKSKTHNYVYKRKKKITFDLVSNIILK
jgi:hypothetical protein